LDNKVGYAILALLLINVVVVIAGFAYLQSEIDLINPPKTNPTQPATEAYPTPTPKAATTPAASPAATESPYKYVVYEWTLKPENINNKDWLKNYGIYNSSLSWRENYIERISRCGAYPENTQGSLASYYFRVEAFVSVDFNEQTGYTKATYTYFNGCLYELETAYAAFKDGSTRWSKTFI